MANVWDAMKKHQAEEAQRQRERHAQAEPAPPVEIQPAETSVARELESAEPIRTTNVATEPPPPRPEPAPTPAATPQREETDWSSLAATAEATPPPQRDGEYVDLLTAYHDRGGATTEEYRALRTSLLAQSADERFCYQVTSANPGEGKTVTCANLSLVMAERIDRRTIIIDCDLRKPMLAKYLDTNNEPGMADILRGSIGLKEAIQPTKAANLSFIPAGLARESEVAELIGRPELEEVVQDLRRRYDYVILDTPPINLVSDAGMIGRATGQALLVVRMHKTHRESVEKAIRLLHAANVKPAGIILTHRRFIIPNYLYRYS